MTAIGPGTRVECINDKWFIEGVISGPIPKDAPVKGGKYTIERIEHRSLEEDYLVLIECTEYILAERCFWSIHHFRPIDEHSTDISILQEAHDRGMRGEPVDGDTVDA